MQIEFEVLVNDQSIVTNVGISWTTAKQWNLKAKGVRGIQVYVLYYYKMWSFPAYFHEENS